MNSDMRHFDVFETCPVALAVCLSLKFFDREEVGAPITHGRGALFGRICTKTIIFNENQQIISTINFKTMKFFPKILFFLWQLEGKL